MSISSGPTSGSNFRNSESLMHFGTAGVAAIWSQGEDLVRLLLIRSRICCSFFVYIVCPGLS